MSAHSWYKPNIHRFCWSVCKHCGLVLLNGEATRILVKKPCPGAD